MKVNKFFIILFVIFVNALNVISVYAQSEIDFTNMASFTKSGTLSVTRFVTLLPAPVSNEYQEITNLNSNAGDFIDLDDTNKVLFYDGAFDGRTFDVYETFTYKSKPIQIDFNNKSQKNEFSGIDPSQYLYSDGKYVDVNNSTIKQIADNLWGNSNDVIDYAKQCYEYVASHYKYINGSWRTLSEILKASGGECGDFTTLFVNLMRCKGIPARHNMGVWVDGGYHVWPDFYHEDYGWIPVDPTFKNSNPNGDYFGKYNGNLIIMSQGMTTFSSSGINVDCEPLQTFYYWYWYNNGNGSISGTHKPSKGNSTDMISDIYSDQKQPQTIFNITGVKQESLKPGLNIIKGQKIWVK